MLENRESLGLYFKKLRVDAGLTQLEVSKSLGYESPQFVSNWERGLALPPPEQVRQLSRLYDTNPKRVLNHMAKIRRAQMFAAAGF